MLSRNRELAEALATADKNDPIWRQLEEELRKTIAGQAPDAPDAADRSEDQDRKDAG
jgi:hypothetical protein